MALGTRGTNNAIRHTAKGAGSGIAKGAEKAQSTSWYKQVRH